MQYLKRVSALLLVTSGKEGVRRSVFVMVAEYNKATAWSTNSPETMAMKKLAMALKTALIAPEIVISTCGYAAR
jgi:hypothetical protein